MHDTTSPGDLPPGISDPLKPAEVARLFSVHTRTVTRWEESGQLPSTRTPGGQRRYWWADVSRFLSQNPDRQQAPRLQPRRRRGQPGSATTIRIGSGHPMPLTLTPVAADVSGPGQVTVILGWTPGGSCVTVITTRLEWLDDLEAAVQEARARGSVEADMKPVLA